MPSSVRQLARAYGRHLGTWYGALATVFVLAIALILPGLGSPGLWEPQERQLADRAAPPIAVEKSATAPMPKPNTDDDACTRTPPPDAKARQLQNRAIVFGRDISDSDGGRRLPFAIMGILTVLAAAGIAMRFAGARAGVLTAIVLVAMPLCALQSRMLTNEIATACGTTLLVYGFIALSRLGAGYGTVLAAIDAAVAVAALVVGQYLGFGGGGMLLGLVVPIAAFAAAGICAPVRREGKTIVGFVLPFVAAAIAATLIGVLVYQLYELQTPKPGMMPIPRTVFGHAIVADGCWSSALGGLWRPDDDLRYIFDSTFEEIAYGTYPWGILAPIAMGMLLVSGDRDRKGAGAITLAWAAIAWIATEAFQRKVGFAIYAAFPALAIAVGVWLDDLLSRRAKSTADTTSDTPAGFILVGLLFLIAVVNFGKDMYSFPDRTTSLLIGGDALPYPKEAKLLFLPTKIWILLVGSLTGLGAGLSLMLWRDGDTRVRKTLRKLSNIAIIIAIAGSIVMAAFWAFVWQPVLANYVSSKAMFETFEELRKPNEKLVIMGDLGHAPASYTDEKPQMVASRNDIVKALAEATTANTRVFAIAPQGELCTLHREMGGNRYYVVEDRNVRNLLLSNKVDGTTDKNPLATSILHTMPAKMQFKPKAPVIWDRKLELIGFDIPQRVERGKKFTVTMYYKVIATVGGKWKSLMHFDGPLRFNGDHWPINDRCPTGTWQPGDYIVDTFTVSAGGKTFPTGRYDLWMGFFTGTAPNWKNMSVSQAPSDMRDTADRVKVTSIILE